MMISIILKIALWIVISLVFLILFLFIYPVFYKAKIRIYSLSYQGLNFVIALNLLSFVFRLELVKEDEEFHSQIKIFGIKVRKKTGFDSKSIEEKEDNEKQNKKNETKERNETVDYEENSNILMRFFYKIKQKAEALFHLYHRMKIKKELYLKLYDTDSCKRAIYRVKTVLPKALKHLLPRRAEGRLRMGFDSCDRTGRIFGYYSLVNSYFLYDVEVFPDFEQEIFEGEIKIKGRIVPLYLIWQIGKLFCNKDVRLTYKRIKKINRR